MGYRAYTDVRGGAGKWEAGLMSELIDSQFAYQYDKLPPHSIEAEQCLIASMMLDKEAIEQASAIISGEAFFQTDHQILFDLLVKMYGVGKPIDAVIIREELLKLDLLEEIGGNGYLARLLDTVPSSAHAAHYASIVREKHLLRQLIDASNQVLRDAYAPQDKADTVLDRSQARFMGIDASVSEMTVKSLGETLADVYDEFGSERPQGLRTCLTDLDAQLAGGLHKGEMIIVAGRPSMGKSAIALDFLVNVAIGGDKTALFSLEMSKEQLASRLLCSLAGVDIHKARRRLLSSDEFSRLAEAAGKYQNIPLVVDDSAGLTITQLRAKSRRLVKSGVKLIAVDYLQLMESPDIKESRNQQISEISRGIKQIARELNIPILAVSQLNRESENRTGNRPRMSDLRESGSIEQDADVIMLLYRDDYYRMTDADFIPNNIAEVIVVKQRQGPTGVVKLLWDGRCTSFRNLAQGIEETPQLNF